VRFFRELLYGLARVTNSLIPKRPQSLVFISRPDFSDNPRHMYDFYRRHCGEELHMSWLCFDREVQRLLEKQGISDVFYLKSIRGVWEYCRAKYIFTNSSSLWQIKSPFQMQIALWHGMPLKNILRMGNEPMESTRPAGNVDLRIATSPITRALIAASFNYDARKVRITGQPRSDALFLNIDLPRKLLDTDAKRYKGILLYMPTYRSGYKAFRDGRGLEDDNIFRFESFSLEKFEAFLKRNRLLFLMKLHPYEEKIFSKSIRSDWIRVVTHRMLLEKRIETYHLLAGATMLLTDYSSVYLDYLLLDRPIVFVPSDLEEYRKKRGFSLEPYEFWTPGAKAFNQNELEEAIADRDHYQEHRALIRELIHTHQDGNACRRVHQAIQEETGTSFCKNT